MGFTAEIIVLRTEQLQIQKGKL